MMLEPIRQLSDLTEKDIRWLTTGTQAIKWRRFEVLPLCERLRLGKVLMFRVSGENSEGIVVLTVDEWEKELWIDVAAGKNILGLEFRELLKDVARRHSLKKLTGYVGRKALMHWYDTHSKAKPVAVLYVEEIE
jgi:hypothetical protein